MLLLSDVDHVEGGCDVAFIGKVLGLHRNTVYRVRARFVREGEMLALYRKQRLTASTPPKIDRHGETQLIQIACSTLPEGRSRWKLNLRANELVNRRFVTSICIETVNKTLKKPASALESRAILHPKVNGGHFVGRGEAFHARMEEILDLYASPPDADEPLERVMNFEICFYNFSVFQWFWSFWSSLKYVLQQKVE